MLTLTASVSVQPLPSVTVTVNVPEVVTIMLCVFSMVDQLYIVPPEAIKVVLAPPQSLLLVIEAIGSAFTVMPVVEVLVQPLPSV